MELTKTINAKGYKQTEVGLIPEDWEVKELKEISLLITKGTTPKRFTDKGVNYVKIESLSGDDINSEKCLFIDDVTHNTDLKRSILNEGDLLFAIAGATIGKCTIVPSKIIPANTNQALAIIRLKEEENKKYVFYFLKSTLMQKYILDNIAGGAQPNLNLAQIGGFYFPLPPLPEQKAIATALSDVDALLLSLDKQITKKKAIKQGAMQELLTPPNKGGKRLPGFEGEWGQVNLNDVCWYQEGPGLRNWQFTDKGIKVINITNLVNGYLNLEKTQRFISIEEFNLMYKHFEIDEMDIVVASSGNSYCKTSIVRKQDLPLVMNTSVIRFKPKAGITYNLLLIFLKSSLFKNQIDLLITGGAQPNFGPVHLKKIKLNLPQTIEEQSRIAQILSDMDLEITSLEAKRQKYVAIKQGMMQELLTGRTRLV